MILRLRFPNSIQMKPMDQKCLSPSFKTGKAGKVAYGGAVVYINALMDKMS